MLVGRGQSPNKALMDFDNKWYGVEEEDEEEEE
jgi:hypothetical protein